ncbi:DUF924-domain-containing protein [Aaosphaeria arxii CBS 175.79]|uniref:DUF924-domain-containing protein n=1 Tax=Aaosphaeria arxii CBS 175.79 TaxID=1450172 RepID=A0A6A5XI06_9PLEO|nr:DUF924-domain-containing protein [Aaosphaeria arxii CBS 175.79]KAF2012410.1 DUF924-domain-containing protein [Aaosphaeria arxii CBS 175.79]
MPDLSLKDIVTHQLLEDVHRFWFSHIVDADHIIVPDVKDAIPWFTQSNAYDSACIAKFGSQLMCLKSLSISGRDILCAANPSTSLHWMSLIILLDQIPRNCFREKDACIAFNVFDNLALYVALKAIEHGIPEQPLVRNRLAYRFWFYMPLEHSETLEMQIMVKEEHVKMFQKIWSFMNDPGDQNDTDFVYCQIVLHQRKTQLEDFENTLRRICKDHEEAIRQFGRFPHRNNALGRVSTKEELAYQQGQNS